MLSIWHVSHPAEIEWLPVTVRCDIPIVFYRLNTKYITSSQNTAKFIALCCTIRYTTTCFGLFFKAIFRLNLLSHESNVPWWQSTLLWWQDLNHLITLALLWRVCRQFSMNEYRLRVWVACTHWYCLHTRHNKANVIRWLRSHHQSSILCHQGALLSRLSRYNLKMALKKRPKHVVV